MVTVRSFVRLLACTGGLLILTACPVVERDPPQVQAIIPATTKVVDEATSRALSEYDSQSGLMRFDGTTSVIASLEPDDVLVAGATGAAPYGFLRKVKEIREESDGTVVLETVQADLTEAIHKGELDEELFLTDENLLDAAVYVEGLTIEPALNKWFDENWVLTFDEVLLDHEEDGQRAFMKVDGTVTMRPWAHFGFEIDNSAFDVWVKRAEVSAGFDQSSDLHFQTSGHASFEEEFKVGELTFGDFKFTIGVVPVVITIKLSIYIGASGEVNVDVDFVIEERFNVRVGAGYFKNQGGWKNLSDGPNLSVGFREPPTVRANAEISGYTAADVSVMLYDVIGPAIGLRTGVTGDFAYPRDPLWLLYGWLEGYFKFIAEFPIVGRVVDYKATIFDYSQELSRAPNNPPEVKASSGTLKVDLNVPVDLTKYISAFDPEEGRLSNYRITSNRDGEVRSVGQAFTTTGKRTLTVTATDKHGLSGSETLDVDVINTPPIVYGSSMNNLWYAETPTYINVFATDPNDTIDCGALTWVTDAREQTFETQGEMCLSRLIFTAPPAGQESASHIVTVTAADPQGAVSEPVSFEIIVAGPPTEPVPIVRSVTFEGCTEVNCVGDPKLLKPYDTAVIPVGGAVVAIVQMEPFSEPLEFRVYEWHYRLPASEWESPLIVSLVGTGTTNRITFFPAYQGLNDYYVNLRTEAGEVFTAGSQTIRIEWYKPVN